MDDKKLIDALNKLSESTGGKTEAIAKARNAALEDRIAAILIEVCMSDLSISAATTELVVSLTHPEWDSDNDDPLDTVLGKTIAEVTRHYPAKPPGANETSTGIRTARNLVELANDPNSVPDESLDFLLRITTGKDMTWWLDWIRQKRVD